MCVCRQSFNNAAHNTELANRAWAAGLAPAAVTGISNEIVCSLCGVHAAASASLLLPKRCV